GNDPNEAEILVPPLPARDLVQRVQACLGASSPVQGELAVGVLPQGVFQKRLHRREASAAGNQYHGPAGGLAQAEVPERQGYGNRVARLEMTVAQQPAKKG